MMVQEEGGVLPQKHRERRFPYRTEGSQERRSTRDWKKKRGKTTEQTKKPDMKKKKK